MYDKQLTCVCFCVLSGGCLCVLQSGGSHAIWPRLAPACLAVHRPQITPTFHRAAHGTSHGCVTACGSANCCSAWLIPSSPQRPSAPGPSKSGGTGPNSASEHNAAISATAHVLVCIIDGGACAKVTIWCILCYQCAADGGL